MNVTLKKGDGSKSGDNLKPGEWGITEDGHVMVRCIHEHADSFPRLGIIKYAPGTFAGPDPRSWQIDAQGNVTPSIWFKDGTFDGKPSPCNWHIFAKLEGWTA